MPYCSRCGVEVDVGVEECPLCFMRIQEDPDKPVKEPVKKKYPDEHVEQPTKRILTPKEKRIRAWEIISASLVIPFLIVTFTNLIIEKTTISWAIFPMITLVLVWLLCTFPLVFAKRPIVMIPGIAISLFGFLALVDYFDNGTIDWFSTLALPIIAIVLILSVVVVLASMKVKQKGMNIAAFILFAVGALNLVLEVIITNEVGPKATVSWSLFVLVPTYIVGGFLMYMHYRFTKDTDFKTKIKAKLQM
jgi:hypothetical protein